MLFLSTFDIGNYVYRIYNVILHFPDLTFFEWRRKFSFFEFCVEMKKKFFSKKKITNLKIERPEKNEKKKPGKKDIDFKRKIMKRALKQPKLFLNQTRNQLLGSVSDI